MAEHGTDLATNTTQNLIADVEAVREHVGVGRFFPTAWDAFRAGAGAGVRTAAGTAGPQPTGSDLVARYDALLNDPDPAVRDRAALDWCSWEDAVLEPDAGRAAGARFAGAPRARLVFARLCAHYFAHHGFLVDGELLAGAERLRDIPAVLIHGRLDLGSPLITAWRMAQALPAAELHIVPGAGHGSGPGMGEALDAALDRFAG